MANLSGTITFPQGGSSWKTIQGRINWEETQIDSSSSPVRSKVHTKIYAKCGTGGTTGKGWNGYVQVGSNSKHSFSSLSSSTTISDSYVLLKEYDDWVEHEADGSKTVTIKGKVAGPSGTSLEGVSSSGSGNVTLTNVPQASTITSVSNGTTPYSPTIVWTPASTSFKYRVEYKYVSGSSTWSVLSDLISPATTSSYSYNGLQLPDGIFVLSPNSPTLTATAVLYTFNSDGTTQVGNVSTKTFTVTLNSSIKPTLSVSNLAEADSGMIAKNWGVFVQGKSKLSFHLGWTYLSPVPASSTVTATTNGQTFTTTSMSGSADYTTSALSSSGSKSVSASITDSRGRTTTASASYTVYEYSKPSITNAVAERCLQNGTLSDTGTYLKYSFASTISSCNGHNTATYQLGYRVKGSNSAYTYVSISNNATNVVLSGVTFSASNSYDIQFRVTDAFNEVVWEDESIGSGFRLVHYNKSKKALALGKSSEATGDNKLLEVALPVTLTEAVTSTEKIETTKSFKIPYNSNNGYGLVDHNDNSIIKDWNNGTITVNATGATLYLGHQTTTQMNFLDGKGMMYSDGSLYMPTGFYSKETGNVGTASGTGKLVIKRASSNEAPNNGVVLEFGNSTSWVGQLYIGDNADQGVYYNGWSNGVRGSWKKLAWSSDIPSTSSSQTLTFTNKSGNANLSGSYVQYGKIVSVDVNISTTAATASGKDIVTAKITNFTVAKNTILVGYVGARSIIGSLTTDQTLTVRNASSSSLASGSSPNIRGTFIIN